MKRRIIICLALLLALCVLGDAIAMLALHRSNQELGALAEAHRIQVMRTNLASSGVRIEMDMMARRAGDSHDELRRLDSVRRFEAALERCGTCHHSPAVQAELDEVRATLDSYVAAAERLFQSQDGQERLPLEREANLAADELTRLSTAMSDRADHQVALRGSDVAASVRRAWLILCGTVIGALAAGGIVAFHLKRRLTRPVEALLEGVERTRQGDHAHRFTIDADGEFRALGEAFNDAYKNLKQAQERVFQAEKMAAVGKLAAGVAHEVGNPLASISSIAQMMRRKGQSPEQAKRIELIMEQIGRISRIVRELLTFSRPTPDKDYQDCVRIPELLDRAVTLLGYDKRAKDIKITRDYPPRLGEVRGDTDKLLLAFTNIIINAFDALSAHPNGTPSLTISARQEDDEVVVLFEDNGPGVNQEQLAFVFEPFFTTKEPGAGTGLGLWICYQVVQKHKGTIRVENGPARGTTVSIRLPAEPVSEPPASDVESGRPEQESRDLAAQQTT